MPLRGYKDGSEYWHADRYLTADLLALADINGELFKLTIFLRNIVPRETREGWPCLPLKLRWMGTQRVQMKDVLPWLVRWAFMPVQETFILPRLLWSAQYKIFFSAPYTIFNLCVPIAQQPGQAVVPGHLSLNVCLYVCTPICHLPIRYFYVIEIQIN